MTEDQPALPQTTELLRSMDREEIRENIAWWTNLRDDHAAKGQTTGVRRCQEEINLWTQELMDV